MSNKTNIDIYMSELEISKQDIKGAIQSKGVTPSGGLSSYAEAILSIPTSSIMGSLEETITENGEYTFNPIDNGVEGYNKVDITVDIEVPEYNSQSKTVEIKKNGSQTVIPDEGYDGLSSVEVKVNVASSGGGKTQIPNGFRFTGGDMAAVDFSQYDWSMVYDTSNFFKGCTHSTGDWSNFEQNFNGEVMSGKQMFYDCSKLTSFPQLDTSKVTNMNYMLYNCGVLTSIPQLDTSNVIDMSHMFNRCYKLTSIPQLDTSKVTNMSYMFYGCQSLTSIPQLDTSKVTNMSYMFASSNLTSIPQLDTSKVTNMSYMFNGCSNLITIPQLDTSKVSIMSDMFNGCSNLITIPQLDTSKVTNMSYMFSSCSKLISVPDFNCVKTTNFGTGSSSSWLYRCTNIESIGVIDCDSITNIGYALGDGTRTYLTHLGGFRNLGKASSVSNTNSSYFLTYAPNLTYESVMNVINLLYDRAANGLSTLTLKLHSNHMAMLSDDDKAIATNKGWTLTT